MTLRIIMKSFDASSRHAFYEFVRFLLAGGVNTLLSYGIYLLFLLLFPYRIAYTISFLAGIALSYWLVSRFVFQRSLSLHSALQFCHLPLPICNGAGYSHASCRAVSHEHTVGACHCSGLHNTPDFFLEPVCDQGLASRP